MKNIKKKRINYIRNYNKQKKIKSLFKKSLMKQKVQNKSNKKKSPYRLIIY